MLDRPQACARSTGAGRRHLLGVVVGIVVVLLACQATSAVLSTYQGVSVRVLVVHG